MNTELLIVVLSIAALHLAALVGGGLGLGIMRLLGREPVRASAVGEPDEA